MGVFFMLQVFGFLDVIKSYVSHKYSNNPIHNPICGFKVVQGPALTWYDPSTRRSHGHMENRALGICITTKRNPELDHEHNMNRCEEG